MSVQARLEPIAVVEDVDDVREAIEQGTGDIMPDGLPGDWRLEFEERAAIREVDGEQPREPAEAEALREIVERMWAAGEF